jgi:energy-coupling factor transporter ATP-binding protein EcfA2
MISDSDLPEGLLDGVAMPSEFSNGPESVDAVDLLLKQYEPPRFIVDHLVPEGSIVLLTGDSGSAKTAFLLHLAVALASGKPIADRFETIPDARVLYVNGEMSEQLIQRYLLEATTGLDVILDRGRLRFEGKNGCASFSVGGLASGSLQAVLADFKPHVVILDTMRALLIEDEREASEVRQVFGWLRRYVLAEHGAVPIVGHHLRKIGQVSNSARQRTSGSSDIIASVDVHLSAKAREGRPMNAILLDKTRVPVEGCTAGTEWPIDAQLAEGIQGYRSLFRAGDPVRTEAQGNALEEAVDELRERILASGPMSIADMGATSGTVKRAYERLRDAGEVIVAGKDGRKTLYGLSASASNERGHEFGD